MDTALALSRTLVCLVALIVAPVAAAAADAPPLAAYGSLPDVERMALSQSGNRFAGIMTITGKRALVMMTSDLQVLRTVPLADEKIRSMDWVGDDRLLVIMSQTEKLDPEFNQKQFEFFHAVLVSPNPQDEQRVVFANDPTMMNAVFGIYGMRDVGGHWRAYLGAVEKERGARGYQLVDTRPQLFAIDAVTNEKQRVADRGPEGDGRTWLLAPDGSVAATLDLETRSGKWLIMAPGGKLLASGIQPHGEVGLIALGKDARSLIYEERNEQDQQTRWHQVPLDGTEKPHEFLKADEVDHTYTDRATGKLIGLLRQGSNGKPQFFDPAQQAAVDKIYQAFPALDVELEDWSGDFSKVLVRTTGNGDSGTWYLVDLTHMSAKALAYERKAIGPEVVGAISRVKYKAADGLDLDGILTLPPGRQARNLPVVLLPHGGPHAEDKEVFDWWAQAFAARGYAVFQPNFRGSTNRDEGFMRAGFGQWGRAMQTDISDGLVELARRGIVDPKRACIVGASYGGYAALAGVTLQKGIYKCAVAVAPVSDLGSLFTSERNDRGHTGMLRRSLLEELGSSTGFDAVSPRHFADKADAPILLIHGRNDTVVPFDQSTKMAAALKAADKPYRLVELREEDHWLSRAATRDQMLEEAVAFVEEYNPSGTAPRHSG